MADEFDEQEMRDERFGVHAPFLDEHRADMRELISDFRYLEAIMYFSCNVRDGPIAWDGRQVLREGLARYGDRDFASIRQSVLAFLRTQLTHWTTLGQDQPPAAQGEAGDPDDQLIREMEEMDNEVCAGLQRDWGLAQTKMVDISRRIGRIAPADPMRGGLEGARLFALGRMDQVSQNLNKAGYTRGGEGWVQPGGSSSGGSSSSPRDVEGLESKLDFYRMYLAEITGALLSGDFAGMDRAAVEGYIGDLRTKITSMERRLEALRQQAASEPSEPSDSIEPAPSEPSETHEPIEPAPSEPGDEYPPEFEFIIDDLQARRKAILDFEESNRIFEYPQRVQREENDINLRLKELVARPERVNAEKIDTLLEELDDFAMRALDETLIIELRETRTLLQELEVRFNPGVAARLRALRAHPGLYKAWARATTRSRARR